MRNEGGAEFHLRVGSAIEDLVVHSAQSLIGGEFESHVRDVLHESRQVTCEQSSSACRAEGSISVTFIAAAQSPSLPINALSKDNMHAG